MEVFVKRKRFRFKRRKKGSLGYLLVSNVLD